MATLDDYKIINNKIELKFSAFIFSKTVVLDFVKDKDKIQKLINIATIALGGNDDNTLKFHYEDNDIEVNRGMLENIINKINKKIN